MTTQSYTNTVSTEFDRSIQTSESRVWLQERTAQTISWAGVSLRIVTALAKSGPKLARWLTRVSQPLRPSQFGSKPLQPQVARSLFARESAYIIERRTHHVWRVAEPHRSRKDRAQDQGRQKADTGSSRAMWTERVV